MMSLLLHYCRILFRCLFFLAALVGFGGDIRAQGVPDLNDTAAMNAWLKQNKVPGLAVGIIRERQLAEIKVFGELEHGRPLPQNAVFNVASITKSIVAYLMLRLVSNGEWDLDEPLNYYWVDPDVQHDSLNRKLTTRHILSHQSGFPNWRWQLPEKKLAFQFEPGTRYQYSGEGYEYLRRALEAKFGKPLERLADDLVFQPLGMKDTRFTWHDSLLPRYAIPHDTNGNALPIPKNTKANAADLVTTTVTDLSTFIIALMNGDGLNAECQHNMFRHHIETKANRYVGLGGFIYDLGNGEFAFSHGGDDPGVHSIYFILPKTGEGMIILTNSDNGPSLLYPSLVSTVLGEEGRAIVDIELK